MEIIDLKPRQGRVELVAKVIDKGEIREFNKFGKQGRVCNAKIKDDSGEIALTLWNDDIDKINIGDRIKIENGYVNEWQGEMQLTTGKFGKLEVLESSGITKDEEEEKKILEKKGIESDEGEHILSEDEAEEEDDFEEEEIK